MAGIGAELLRLATLLLVVFAISSAAAAPKTEKLSHIRVYWHEILGGENPNVVQIIAPISNNSRTAFGLVRMMDCPLTEGSDPRSKVWGRAQGLYAAASQEENRSLLMAMNFAFFSGKYNGSSIAILGRTTVVEKVREMAVIGGTGAFRFGRGFTIATAVNFDPNSMSPVVQYDLYLLHY